jgi:hypothetical protein
MARLTHVSVVLLGVVGGATALAVMATGCGSSTVAPEDAGSDATEQTDSTQTSDVTTKDVTGEKDGSKDASPPDAGGDADAANSSDAPTCTTLISVLAPPSDGGTDADAADAADAADVGPPGPVLVTGFDLSTAATATDGWGAQVDTNLVDGGLSGSAVSYSATVGHSCPGSVVLTAPFISFSPATDAAIVMQQVEINYNYNGNPQGYPLWTNFTKLHYWVKVAFEGADGGTVTGDASALDFTGLDYNNNYAQWFDYNAASYNGTGSTNFFAGSTFSSGDWEEVILALNDATQASAADGGFPTPAGLTCDTGNACKFASQLAVAGMPEGGPAVPATTLLYVDDIWLE